MTHEELIQEHARITKEYYIDKTMTKEDFELAHNANAIAKKQYEV